MNSDIALLLEIVDQAYEKKAWHGPNLRGSIRGVTAAEAAWRPGRGRHNIHEIVVHAAYWKYAVRRRILGGKRGSFTIAGSNWFPRAGKADQRAWKADVALLEREHALLCEAIAACPPEQLQRVTPGGKVTCATLIYGIACHDVYHAGQIQLIKRLKR
jgi:uncharacterized damage-inducible protein DinB